jgi:c-di-GMP-binding flagellar brake protein YcgR
VNGTERRRFVRYEVRATIELRAGGQAYRSETEDLGAGGCRVAVPAAVEKGTPVWIRLTSERAGAAVEGEASVVWASKDLPCRLGVQFSDEVAELVIPFMRALLGPVPVRTGE